MWVFCFGSQVVESWSIKGFEIGVDIFKLCFYPDLDESIPVSLWNCLLFVNPEDFRIILKKLFWGIWILLILVEDAAAHIGQAYNSD